MDISASTVCVRIQDYPEVREVITAAQDVVAAKGFAEYETLPFALSEAIDALRESLASLGEPPPRRRLLEL